MSVRIVLAGPRRPIGRRLLHAVAVVLSVPLIVVGALGLAGSALMAAWLVITVLDDSAVSADDARGAAQIAGVSVAAAVIGLGLGRRLLRGRRRLVLFLRRFGFADATRTVSFAAAEVIGRSWRLVTLDDDRVQAVGGARGPRRLSGIAALVTGVVTVAGALWLALGGAAGIFDRTVGGVTPPGADAGIVESLAAVIVGTLVAAFVAVLVVIFFVVVLTVLGVSSAMVTTTYGLSRRSERAKRVAIAAADDVGRVGAAVARRSRRIFAPRLVVVTVADPVWQNAVRAFAAGAAAVILDVSVPSENLRWEIGEVLPRFGHRCILVGRLDLVTAPGPDGVPRFSSPLAADLDGHEVLAYGTSPADLRRFGRALAARLDATV